MYALIREPNKPLEVTPKILPLFTDYCNVVTDKVNQSFLKGVTRN